MRYDPSTDERPKSRDLGGLRRLIGFVLPYRGRLLLAVAALVVAAATVLAFGVVIREVVDKGIGSGSTAALNDALLLFLAVSAISSSPARPTSSGICSCSRCWLIKIRAR